MGRSWWLAVALVGCNFPSPVPGTSNAGGMDGPVAADASVDAPVAKNKPRRITLVIPGGQVAGPLVDFPVYVDLGDATSRADLKANLDAAGANLSFRLRSGMATTPLAHELASWDPASGRLIAWVKLPTIEATAGDDTRFELEYGTPEVAVPANPAAVWSNGFVAVFHLDSLSDTTFANSAGSGNNGTASNLNAGRVVTAQLGRGVDFNNNNQVITFSNSITGGGPSTFSAWVSQRTTNDNDSLIQVGNGQASRARFFYTRYNSANLGSGLYVSDWVTGTGIQNAGFRLLHWTYEAQQGRVYVNAAATGDSPFAYATPADTTGTDGRIGNAKMPDFGTNMGLDGIVDEVRIATVARSAAWIGAEYSNQVSPGTFAVPAAPEDVPGS